MRHYNLHSEVLKDWLRLCLHIDDERHYVIGRVSQFNSLSTDGPLVSSLIGTGTTLHQLNSSSALEEISCTKELVNYLDC